MQSATVRLASRPNGRTWRDRVVPTTWLKATSALCGRFCPPPDRDLGEAVRKYSCRSRIMIRSGRHSTHRYAPNFLAMRKLGSVHL